MSRPLLLLLLLLPFTDLHAAEHYSSLAFRETPYAAYRGIVPLTAEQAKARNHYRFRHDETGRLIEIDFRLGDTPRPVNHTANYFMPTSRVVITYDRNGERHRYFDHHGHPVLVDDVVLEARYEHDGQGRRTALRYFGADGQPVENRWTIHSYHWRHESDDTVVEWRKNLAGQTVDLRPNFEFRVVRFHYRDGWLDLMQNLDRAGNLIENASGVAQDRIAYHPNGAFAGWTVLDAEGARTRGNSPNVSRGLVDTGDWGYETAERYHDEQGVAMPIAYGWQRSRAVYDRVGNWAWRGFFDQTGKPMVVRELGYHRYDFTWDQEGRRLLARWYYDDKGQRAAHVDRGFAGAEFEYADGVDATRIRFLDAAGAVVARADNGVAIIERRYDDQGRRIEERYLGVDGRLVNDQRRGYARIERGYREDGLPMPPVYLDVSGEVVER